MLQPGWGGQGYENWGNNEKKWKKNISRVISVTGNTPKKVQKCPHAGPHETTVSELISNYCCMAAGHIVAIRAAIIVISHWQVSRGPFLLKCRKLNSTTLWDEWWLPGRWSAPARCVYAADIWQIKFKLKLTAMWTGSSLGHTPPFGDSLATSKQIPQHLNIFCQLDDFGIILAGHGRSHRLQQRHCLNMSQLWNVVKLFFIYVIYAYNHEYSR